jgi:hypothetical protein
MIKNNRDFNWRTKIGSSMFKHHFVIGCCSCAITELLTPKLHIVRFADQKDVFIHIIPKLKICSCIRVMKLIQLCFGPTRVSQI